MQAAFVPADEAAGPRETKIWGEVESLTSAGLCLEQLISGWLEKELPLQGGRSVSAARLPEAVDPTLILSLDMNGRPLAYSTLEKRRLIDAWGEYPLLPEELISLADRESAIINPHWLESRDRALQILWDNRLSEYAMPQQSIMPMVLSYALSSAGFARFHKDSIEGSDSRIYSVYRGTFVFLGKNFEGGWVENIVVKKHGRNMPCYRAKE